MSATEPAAQFNIHEAKTHLSRLIERGAAGRRSSSAKPANRWHVWTCTEDSHSRGSLAAGVGGWSSTTTLTSYRRRSPRRSVASTWSRQAAEGRGGGRCRRPRGRHAARRRRASRAGSPGHRTSPVRRRALGVQCPALAVPWNSGELRETVPRPASRPTGSSRLRDRDLDRVPAAVTEDQ